MLRANAEKPKHRRRHGEGGKGDRAYGAEACGGVDGEEGDLVDLGAEEGELRELGEAAVAGGELGGAGVEGAVGGEGEAEGEAVPALDLRVGARVVDAVGVPRGGQRREGGGEGEGQGEQQRRGGGHGGEIRRGLGGGKGRHSLPTLNSVFFFFFGGGKLARVELRKEEKLVGDSDGSGCGE